MPLEAYGLPSDVLLWKAALLTVISFAVGILGGFVGLALGTMRLPALLLLGAAPSLAGGTNIIVSTSSALLGSVRHLQEGRVAWRLAAVMGIPSMVGAFIGGFASRWAPDAVLVVAVGVLVFWQGVELLQKFRSEGVPGGSGASGGSLDPELSLRTPRGLAGSGIGLGVGLVGGAVGLILGSMRLPAMIRVMGIDPRTAAGTNLLIGFAMGSMGWIGHVSQGNVDYPIAALMSANRHGGQLPRGSAHGPRRPVQAGGRHGSGPAGNRRPARMAWARLGQRPVGASMCCAARPPRCRV